MLQELQIRNIAIIESLSLSFSQGLNLLTGETGAGKSIIIDALGLALGERADYDLIRSGTDQAFVQASFSNLSANTLTDLTDELGIPFEGDLHLRRRLRSNGVSQAWVNDVQVNLTTMQRFGNALVTVHGQGEGDELLSAEGQQSLLDLAAGTTDLRLEIEALYARIAELEAELEELSRDDRSRERELDLLRHQIKEIERAELEDSEEKELEAERRLLLHAERIQQLGHGVWTGLYEGEEALTQQLAAIEKSVAELADIDEALTGQFELLHGLRLQLEEFATDIRDYTERAEADPRRLQWVQDRLDTYRSLQRKYGPGTDGVMHFLDNAKKEREKLENADERLEEVEHQLKKLNDSWKNKAAELTRQRKEAVAGLSAKVDSHLADLAMERAHFDVDIAPHPRGKTRSGADRITFMLQTNPGEAPKPLSKVASGGEQSRLMLAIKSGISQPEEHHTVIFDEVDTGIGGRVAEYVGRKLAVLSQWQQVICITHLPQIAAFADRHTVVNKQLSDDMTHVSVETLAEEQQIDEIARMLGGENLTETSRQHARQLIEGAQLHHGRRSP